MSADKQKTDQCSPTQWIESEYFFTFCSLFLCRHKVLSVDSNLFWCGTRRWFLVNRAETECLCHVTMLGNNKKNSNLSNINEELEELFSTWYFHTYIYILLYSVLLSSLPRAFLSHSLSDFQLWTQKLSEQFLDSFFTSLTAYLAGWMQHKYHHRRILGMLQK